MIACDHPGTTTQHLDSVVTTWCDTCGACLTATVAAPPLADLVAPDGRHYQQQPLPEEEDR